MRQGVLPDLDLAATQVDVSKSERRLAGSRDGVVGGAADQVSALSWVVVPAERKNHACTFVRDQGILCIAEHIRIAGIDPRVQGIVLHRHAERSRMLRGRSARKREPVGRPGRHVIRGHLVVEEEKAIAPTSPKARAAYKDVGEALKVTVVVAGNCQGRET